jgi:hypothetical protein
LLSLVVAFGACKKEKEPESTKPVPYTEVLFGKTINYNFIKFADQENLPYDSIPADGMLGLSVAEINHSGYYGFTSDSGEIKVAVLTAKDAEFFSNQGNASAAMTYTSRFNNKYSFGSEMPIVCKISSSAVHGNDTLEISPGGDKIRINYISKYTNLFASDSIKVVP